MPDDIFEPERILRWDAASVVDTTAEGHNGDATVTFRWNISLGSLEACRQWADKERRSITADFEVEGKSYNAPWRHVSIASQQRSKDRKGYYFEHTFAKGWNTTLATATGSPNTINWPLGRHVTGSDSDGVAGNVTVTGGASAITNTASDLPATLFTIEFPHCDSSVITTIIAEFNSATYTNPNPEGVAITGTFHKILTAHRQEQDGSCTVIVRIGQPQLTVVAYEDVGTAFEADVFYLFQVPKDLGSAIVNAWKANESNAGRSARVSYDSTNEFMNIVLRRRVAGVLNLTTDLIPVSASAGIVYHFAWGYDETNLATFLADHDGPLAQGESRSTDVRTRGDGLFDAQVREGHEQGFTSVLTQIGSKHITRDITKGWHASEVPEVTIADGETYSIDHTLNEDGSETFTLNKDRRESITSIAIQFSNRLPSVESFGLSVDKKIFKGLADTEVNALVLAGSTYYFIEGLTYNDDNTWDGQLNQLTYVVTPPTGSLAVFSNHRISMTQTEYMTHRQRPYEFEYKLRTGVKGTTVVAMPGLYRYKRKNTYEVVFSLTRAQSSGTNQAEGIKRLAGGEINNSTMTRIQVNGISYWFSKRVIPTSDEDPWVRVSVLPLALP